MFAALAALATFAAPAPALRAQAADAGFTGAVRDSLGNPVARATVEAVHGPTGYLARALTNDDGRYVMPGLPLGGPYTLAARRIGFRPATRSGLTLTIGARPVIDFALVATATTLKEVAIRADPAEGRADRVGGSTRVAREQINALPVIDRNFSGLTAIDPLAGAQLSLGGQRWTSTDIRIDGAQTRNMLRAGEANGGPQAIPLDAVREFEVNTAVFDAGQGREGGGQVAVATRFGTNTPEGRVFASYRNQQLAAPTDFQSRPRSARPAGFLQSGFSFGGPLVRDKAHVFVAYERQDSNEPIFTGDVSTTQAQLAAGIAKDSLARILDVLGRLYGTNTSTNQLGKLDRRPLSQSALARVDWQLSPADRATFRATFSGYDSPLAGGVDQAIALREARSSFRSSEMHLVSTLSSLLGVATHNEAQLAFNNSSRELTPEDPGIPRGFIQVRSTLPDGSTGNTTVQFGGNRLAPDQSREWTLQARDRLTVERGRVLWSFGTDNTLTGTRTLIAESQTGLFTFPSIAALEARAPNRYQRTVPLAGSSPVTRQHVLELGAFAQAEWRLSQAVTLTAGLRWDGTDFLTAPPTNAAVDAAFNVKTGSAPSDWSQWQPRVEAVWRVDPQSRDVVRAGAGLFTAQAPYYAQHNQLLYTGTALADIDLRNAAVPAPNFPGYRADPSTVPGLAAGAALPPPYVNVVGDWHAPRSEKAVVAWEHRFSDALSATFGAHYTRTFDEYQYIDRNLRAAPAFTLDNEGGRGVWVPASTIATATGTTDVRNASANPAFARVIALESKAAGEAVSMSAGAAFAIGPRVEGTLGYAWSRARDNSTYGCCLARTATTFTPIVDDPRNLAQAWAPSDLDARNRIVGTLTAHAPFGIVAAARYTGVSGRPFSLVTDGDINGDEANGNDLAFLFDPGNPSTPADVAASMRKVMANPANLAAAYIRSHLGQVSGRNAIYTPFTHRVDLRLSRAFAAVASTRAELTLDVYNVGNLINSSWGADYMFPLGISSQNPFVNRLPLLRVVGFDPVAKRYKYTVNESAGALPKGGDPYQVQMGMRFGW
ncbi:MAG: carboxypeptidase regulatory-like domain-containing protein [Gemmatimonadales bacterium]